MTHATLLRAFLVSALGLAISAPAPALADDVKVAAKPADPAVARVMVQLAHAQKALGKLPKARTNSNRIKTLDRALHFLRSARGVVVKREGAVFDSLLEDIDPLLLRALNDKTRILISRTSFSKAIRSNEEALAIDDRNGDALDLYDRIVESESTDYSDDLYVGSVAYERIHRRRGSLFGVALRHHRSRDLRRRCDGSGRRFGNSGGIAFEQGADVDPNVARNAPGRSAENPGFGFGDERRTRSTTRVGAAAGRLGSMSFGVFPRVQRDIGSGAFGRARHPSEPGAAPQIGRGTAPTTRVGSAAGKLGRMSFGVFPRVQNSRGQPVGHSSGVVRSPAVRNNAAVRFNPSAISR